MTSSVRLSASDLETLARITHAEAGGQGHVGEAAVLHVIRTRMQAGTFGGTSVRDVVYAPMQFEPTRTAAGQARMANLSGAELERLKGLAAAVFSGEVPDPTGGATNFANVSVQQGRGHVPEWIRRMGGSAVQIGDHTFFGGDRAQAQSVLSSPAFQEAMRSAGGNYAGLLARFNADRIVSERVTALLRTPDQARASMRAGATGMDAYQSQEALQLFLNHSAAGITPEQLTRAGINMDAYARERGVMSPEALEALTDEQRRAKIASGEIMPFGDGQYLDVSKIQFGEQSQKMLDLIQQHLNQLRTSDPERFNQLATQLIREQQAIQEQRAVARRQEVLDAIHANGANGDNVFAVLLIAMFLIATGHGDMAQEVLNRAFGVSAGGAGQGAEAGRGSSAGGGGAVGGRFTDLTTLNESNVRDLFAAAPSGNTVREQVVEFARRFVGIGEVGRNGGDIVRISNGYMGDEWCGGYADMAPSTVLQRLMGKPLTDGSTASGGVGRLSAAYYKQVGQNQGAYFAHGAETPQPGDFVFFSVPRNNSGHHVGIVTAVHEDGSVTYVAGNEGDRVVERRSSGRSGGAGPIVGFTSLSRLTQRLHNIDIDAPVAGLNRQPAPSRHGSLDPTEQHRAAALAAQAAAAEAARLAALEAARIAEEQARQQAALEAAQRAALQATSEIRGNKSVQETTATASTTGNDTVASAAAGLRQGGVLNAQPTDAGPPAPPANMAAITPQPATAALALA